jgi:hypothetical protein
LAICGITVPGRLPSRKARSSAAMRSRAWPARPGMAWPSTARPSVPWQAAQVAASERTGAVPAGCACGRDRRLHVSTSPALGQRHRGDPSIDPHDDRRS